MSNIIGKKFLLSIICSAVLTAPSFAVSESSVECNKCPQEKNHKNANHNERLINAAKNGYLNQAKEPVDNKVITENSIDESPERAVEAKLFHSSFYDENVTMLKNVKKRNRQEEQTKTIKKRNRQPSLIEQTSYDAFCYAISPFLSKNEQGEFRLLSKEVKKRINNLWRTEFKKANKDAVNKALTKTAEHGLFELVDFLVSYHKTRSKITGKSWYSISGALYKAAKMGHVKIVERLLKEEDLCSKLISNKRLQSGANGALYEAVKNGSIKIVQLLITNKIIQEKNLFSEKDLVWILYEAAKRGHKKIVISLITNEYIREKITEKTINETLEIAAWKNHKAIITFIMNDPIAKKITDKNVISLCNLRLANDDQWDGLFEKILENIEAKQVCKMLAQAAMHGFFKFVVSFVSNKPFKNKIMAHKFLKHCGSHALLQAAKNGYIEIVKILINNFTTMRPYSVSKSLGEAASKGDIEIVRLLIEHKNTKDKILPLKKGKKRSSHDNHDVDTALIRAAKNGHLEVVKLLATHANTRNKLIDGVKHAILWAARRKHDEIVEFLMTNPNTNKFFAINKEVKENLHARYSYIDINHILKEMASMGRAKIITLLFEYAGKEITQKGIEKAQENAKTFEILLLIEKLRNPEHKDVNDIFKRMNKSAAKKVLLKVAREGFLEHVKTLVATKKFDIYTIYEAIEEASRGGNLNVIKHLVNNPTTRKLITSNKGDFPNLDSALRYAVIRGHKDIVIFLATNPITNRNITKSDYAFDETATHNHIEIMKFLAEDKSIKDKLGSFGVNHAFDIAAGKRNIKMIKYLSTHKKLRSKGVDEALKNAVRNNCFEIVEFLLSDPNTKGKITPGLPNEYGGVNESIYWASLYGYTEMVEILITDPATKKHVRLGDSWEGVNGGIHHAKKEGHQDIVEMLEAFKQEHFNNQAE